LVAHGFAHGEEALAFARTLTFARVVFGFAVVLAFAGVDAIAMHSGISGLSLSDNTSKHGSGSHSEGGTGSSGFNVHSRIPHELMESV
jgi:hypothetical protein